MIREKGDYIMIIKDFIKETKKKNANLEKILEVRTYIPIAEKKAILDDILDRCFIVEDGVLTCDYVLKRMAFELAMIKYHTNLDIDITSEEDYDEIRSLGTNFYELYAADHEECHLYFEGMVKELCSQYSIESSMARLANKLSGSIEGLVENISQKIEGLDIGFEGKELEQFKDLLNKYGK
jgi:hypothetical protein